MQNKNAETWKFHEQVYGKDFPYENFAPMFRAELYRPEQWADIFARSGAKYVVLTSKHHEGFCLWPNQDYDDYRTTAGLIQILIGMVSQGGNLLLDVGPAADGTIPVIMQDRLVEMGQWLKVNGEAIYGTLPSPWGAQKFDWGACTSRPGKIYVHLYKRPGDTLTLPPLKDSLKDKGGIKIKTAYLLADPTHKPLQVKSNASGITLHLPDHLPDKNATVVVIEL